MKNSKMITRGRLITKPETQKWMQQCETAFELQLRSLYQTTVDAMLTAHKLRFWIQSVMFLDDSVKWIPEINMAVKFVPKGQEGAEIIIERLP